MAKQHEEFLCKYFEKNPEAVVVGEEMVKMLQKEFEGVSDVNCRKVISNVVKKDLLRNSAPITFGRNQYAYFSAKRKLIILR